MTKVTVTPPSVIQVRTTTSQPKATGVNYGGVYNLKRANDLSMLGVQDGDVITYQADTDSFIVEPAVNNIKIDNGFF